MATEISTVKKELLKQLKMRSREQFELHEKACIIRNSTVSNNIYLRALIEISNICENDCFYCGIRKSNKLIKRYYMSESDILKIVKNCVDIGYTSIVLQSGEQKNDRAIEFLNEIIFKIKNKFPELGITLSVGEQTRETYEKFFQSGAHRYLLRIESSVPEHYKHLHPSSMSYKKRKQCLLDLRDIGYQLGSGVLIASPGQKLENLVEDLLFLKDIDVDMVGMGPHIPNVDTPFNQSDYSRDESLDITLNMIASLRLLMPDINIASTTALDVLDVSGRALGLNAGANVIMPQETPKKYSDDYRLYAMKHNRKKNIEEIATSVNMNVVFERWGDSQHFMKRRQNGSSCRAR